MFCSTPALKSTSILLAPPWIQNSRRKRPHRTRMQFLRQCFEFFLHVDKPLSEVIVHYGTTTYGILFLVIFCETGLVVTPFLPGDSLLFAAGAFAAAGSFKVALLYPLLSFAAVAG